MSYYILVEEWNYPDNSGREVFPNTFDSNLIFADCDICKVFEKWNNL